MKVQGVLLDVTVIVGALGEDDEGQTYPYAQVYKFDVDDTRLEAFLAACMDESVHCDRMMADVDWRARKT